MNLAEVLGLFLNLPSLLGSIASHYPPSLSDGKLLKEDNLLGEQKGLEEITKALFNLRLQDSWVFFFSRPVARYVVIPACLCS